MNMDQFNDGEVILLSNKLYLQRVLYFSITTFIVIYGTVLAVRELYLSPTDAFYVLPVAILATTFGANTAYHNYFTHKTFSAGPVFKFILAVLGTILCQDSLARWTTTHLRHHRHVDVVDRDPHTPRQFGTNKFILLTLGIFWAAIGWKYSRISTKKSYYAKHIINDPLLNWFDRHFVIISYSGFLLPFIIGYFTGGLDTGIKYFAYFGAFRVFVGYFFSEFVVNGLCHTIGSVKFNSKGNATNIESLSLISMGATLHHNHHAFPRALTPAIDGEIDPMKWAYYLLAKLGIMTNINVITDDEIASKKLQ